MSQAHLLRGVMVALALLISLFIQAAIAYIPDKMGDFRMYKRWGKSISSLGINGAFFSPPKFEGDLIDYLPVIPYVLGATTALNDAHNIATLNRLGNQDNLLLKLPMILPNVLISLLIFLSLRNWEGFKVSFWTMLLYAFNPAVIFDSAYWGQADSLHCLFALLSFLFLFKKKPELAWMLMTLAIFTKPHAWPLAPLLGLLTVRDYHLNRLFTSVAAALLVAVLILAPFIAEGNTIRIIDRMLSYTNVPGITINAHNFWWIVTIGTSYIPTSREFLPFLSYKITSILLFSIFYLAVVAKLWKEHRTKQTIYYIMLVSFAFFIFGPGMRENYMLTIFPFFALVCLQDKQLLWAYLLLTVTFLLNMILHDPYPMITYYYGITFDESLVTRKLFYNREFMSTPHLVLTLVNSVLNVSLFLYLVNYAWGFFGRKYDENAGKTGLFIASETK